MSPRERLARVVLGAALTAGGVILFVVGKAHDPMNRPAFIAIVLIIAGLTVVGQGLRGRRGPPVRHEPAGPASDVRAALAVPSVLLAWLVPGLGHWISGRRGKAVLYFTVITATFTAGVLLAHGRNLSYERDAIYFLAYIWNGAETALGWLIAGHLERTHEIPFLQVGFLYTAVAGLLNLVAIMDLVALYGRAAQDEPAPGGSA